MKTRTSVRQQTALLLAEPVPRITPETHGKSPANRQGAATTTTTTTTSDNNPNHDHEEVAWNRHFEELVRYAEQHGNCLVPRRYPPNKELAAWVATQRLNYRSSQEQQQQQGRSPTASTVVQDTTTTALTPERIQKLQELGFSWQDIPTAATVSASSHSETRQAISEEPNIVSEEEKEWNTHFAALNDFVAVQGHANVPNRFPSNPKLCRWVVQQRQSYKQQQLKQQQQQQQQQNSGRRQRTVPAESTATGMTKKQQTALESIGFQWNTEFVPTKFQTKNSEYDHDQVWNQRYQAVKQYYEEHDHCDVPPSVNPSLAQWVAAVRREYQKQDQGQGYCLTDAQRFNLEKMEFSTSSKPLDPSEREWFERYRELRQYQERHHGSTSVPWSFPGGLGKWVAEQRRAYHKRRGDARSSKKKKSKTNATSSATSSDSLTDAQIEKLDDIDFDWQDNANDVSQASAEDDDDNRRNSKNGGPKSATSKIRVSSSRVSSKKEHSWQEHFDALVQYQAEHDGDTAVPREYPPNQALADWVVEQRQLYQEQLQKSSTSKRVRAGLTAERVTQLNAIHFQWEDEVDDDDESTFPGDQPQHVKVRASIKSRRKSESKSSIDNGTTTNVKNTTIRPRKPNKKHVPAGGQTVYERSASSQTLRGNDITPRLETPTRRSTRKVPEVRGKSPTSRSEKGDESARHEGTSKSWMNQLDDLKNYLKDHKGKLPTGDTALGQWVEDQRNREESLSLEQWKQLQVVLGTWPRKDANGSVPHEQANEEKSDDDDDVDVVDDEDDDDDDDDDIMLSSLLKSHKRKAKPQFDEDDDNMPLIYLKKRSKKSAVIQDRDDNDDDAMIDEDDMPLIFLKHKKVFHKRVVKTTDDMDDDDIMLSSLRKPKPATIQKDVQVTPAPPTAPAPTPGIATTTTKTTQHLPAKPKRVSNAPPDAAPNGTTAPKQPRRPHKPKQPRRPRASKKDRTVPPPPPPPPSFLFPHLAFLQQQQLPFPPPFFFALPHMPFGPPMLPWDMSTQFPSVDATGTATAPTLTDAGLPPFGPLVMNLQHFSLRPPSPVNNPNTPFGDAVIGETAEI